MYACILYFSNDNFIMLGCLSFDSYKGQKILYRALFLGGCQFLCLFIVISDWVNYNVAIFTSPR